MRAKKFGVLLLGKCLKAQRSLWFVEDSFMGTSVLCWFIDQIRVTVAGLERWVNG